MRVIFEKQYQVFHCVANIKDESAKPAMKYVLVEPSGLMVAADGVSMAIAPCLIELDKGESPRKALISVEAFKLAVKATPAKQTNATIEVTSSEAIVHKLEYRAVTDLWLDSGYFDWAAAMPVPPEGGLEQTAVGFDADLLYRMAKALGTGHLSFVFTQRGTLVIPIGLQSIGFIMPLALGSEESPIETLEKRIGRPVRDMIGAR